MMVKQVLLLPFLTLLLVSFGSCRSFKQPELKAIENVKAPSLGFKNTVVTLDLHFYNPNKSRVKFKNASGEAWVDGQKLGNFSVDSSMTIPSKADFWLPVKLEMEMKDALRHAGIFISQEQVYLKIDGRARLGKAGIYVTYPIRYEGKQDLRKLVK
jgi:LEA14-like dessication related protein